MQEMKRVLIIDDEPRIRALYGRILADAGFDVRMASNGEDAVEKLIREKMDLVLLDISMPRINGRGLFEIIQEYDPRIKVIVSSVYPLHVQRIMLPEAWDYHDKAHGSSTLLEKIFSVSSI